eukprot:GDKJ01036098.1.p1 GENE.GDKJ01036098.1~~GDKJ01036098.1.p1  ORF type:complete len:1442 (-),score=437.13 GDKJ01036098.1:120-4445(-)
MGSPQMFNWWTTPEPNPTPTSSTQTKNEPESTGPVNSMFSGMAVDEDIPVKNDEEVLQYSMVSISQSSYTIPNGVPQVPVNPFSQAVPTVNPVSTVNNTIAPTSSSFIKKARRVPAFAQRNAANATVNPFQASENAYPAIFEKMTTTEHPDSSQMVSPSAQSVPIKNLAVETAKTAAGMFTAIAQSELHQRNDILRADVAIINSSKDAAYLGGGGMFGGMTMDASETTQSPVNQSEENHYASLVQEMKKNTNQQFLENRVPVISRDPTDPNVKISDLKGAKDIKTWLGCQTERLKVLQMSYSEEINFYSQECARKQARIIEIEKMLLKLEEEQTAAVEVDDFDRAAELDNEILNLKVEKGEANQIIILSEEKMRSLQEKLPVVSEQRLETFSKIRDRLENLLDDEVAVLDSQVEQSKRLLFEEESNLKLERARVLLACKHLQDDEQRVKVESDQITSAMDAKIAPFVGERQELSIVQMSIEGDIAELERRLAEKHQELESVSIRINAIDKEVDSVKARFARQRERIYSAEARIKENRVEVEQDEQKLAEAESNFQESQAHHEETVNEAANVRDMCNAIIQGSEEVEAFLLKELSVRLHWNETLTGNAPTTERSPLPNFGIPSMGSSSAILVGGDKSAADYYAENNMNRSCPSLSPNAIALSPSIDSTHRMAPSRNVSLTMTPKKVLTPLISNARTNANQQATAAEFKLKEAQRNLNAAESHVAALHEENLTSQDSIAQIDARLPLLAAEKKAAAATRNFKDAARVAASIRQIEDTKLELERRIEKIKEELEVANGEVFECKRGLTEAQEIVTKLKKEKDKERSTFLKMYLDDLLNLCRSVPEGRVSLHARKLLYTAGWIDVIASEVESTISILLNPLEKEEQSNEKDALDKWSKEIRALIEATRKALHNAFVEKNHDSSPKGEDEAVLAVSFGIEGEIKLEVTEEQQAAEVAPELSESLQSNPQEIEVNVEAEETLVQPEEEATVVLTERDLMLIAAEVSQLEAEEEAIINKQALMDAEVERLAEIEDFESAEAAQFEIEKLDERVTEVQERIINLQMLLNGDYSCGFFGYGTARGDEKVQVDDTVETVDVEEEAVVAEKDEVQEHYQIEGDDCAVGASTPHEEEVRQKEFPRVEAENEKEDVAPETQLIHQELTFSHVEVTEPHARAQIEIVKDESAGIVNATDDVTHVDVVHQEETSEFENHRDEEGGKVSLQNEIVSSVSAIHSASRVFVDLEKVQGETENGGGLFGGLQVEEADMNAHDGCEEVKESSLFAGFHVETGKEQKELEEQLETSDGVLSVNVVAQFLKEENEEEIKDEEKNDASIHSALNHQFTQSAALLSASIFEDEEAKEIEVLHHPVASSTKTTPLPVHLVESQPLNNIELHLANVSSLPSVTTPLPHKAVPRAASAQVDVGGLDELDALFDDPDVKAVLQSHHHKQ